MFTTGCVLIALSVGAPFKLKLIEYVLNARHTRIILNEQKQKINKVLHS